MKNYVTKIIYINLKHRADRRDFMERQLSKLGIPYERFDAIKVTSESLTQPGGEHYKYIDRARFRGIDPGRVGVWLSFYFIHKRALKESWGNYLILEDDCELKGGWLEMLNEYVNEKKIPDDWDMIRSCWESHETKVEKFKSGHRLGKFADENSHNISGGAHFTFCRGDSCQKIIDLMDADHIMAQDAVYSTHMINVYHSKFKVETGGFSSDIFQQKVHVIDKKVLYFNAYGGNFGDEISPLIVKRLNAECETFNLHEIPFPWKSQFLEWLNRNPKCMSSIGSIMHLLPAGCRIWGTGYNPNYKRVPEHCKVFATRGPLSMKYLNDNGYDLKAEDIAFGDPALLIPRLFPEWLEPVDIKHEVTLIPHRNDKNYYANANGKLNIVQCDSGVENVINQIRASKKIISSSLHGVIVGEMLNKDAVWLQLPKSKKSETDAKYQDYYQSTGRYDVIPARTLDEAMEMEVAKPIYDDTRLYESFYECLNYGD